jgi:hypothetical protein
MRVLVVALGLVLACQTRPEPSGGQIPPVPVEPAEQVESTEASKPPGPPADGRPDELHRLEGQPEAALLAELGDPTSKREFSMGECCNEFEIELYNTYPPDAGHERVRIRQWDWDYDGYTLTVWLHERDSAWQVLETSRYGDDVEF